ncbi:hypothetical protein [Natrinema amylolyticum]|uniref:hypothetical protein n=1 Tax=Natrinema amylolyticum TaxID=2878679 RepID=UPI001CFAB65D|nr:hypothetical protein [Natrinema amylolyticum]
MSHDPRRISAIADEVRAVYYSLIRDVDAHDDGIGREPPADFGVDPVADQLYLPLDLWNSDRKPSRTVPALVAYDPYLDRKDRHELQRIMVGLDVLVTMLDEFIDSAQSHSEYRLQLAVNIAFASLLSFESIPDDAAEIHEAVVSYLVETARIPTIERTVQRELDEITSPERAMELMRFSYASRARDISVFGQLPAYRSDVDDGTASRIVSDLETYRAHYLLFDDIRDVRQDARNGIETPVLWLIKTSDDLDEIVDELAEIFQAFEYAETPYRAALRELEREPENLRDELAAAMDSLTTESDAVSNPVRSS